MLKTKKSVKHIIATAIVGIIFFFIGEALFPALTDKMYTPLGIALYVLIFSIVVFAGYSLISAFAPMRDKSGASGNRKTALMLILVLFVLAFVFEFIYELGKNAIPDPTSYVFLIDDSGSMAGNDPDNKRADAIAQLMQDDTTTPYAVYKFDSGATLMKEMGTYRNGDISQFAFQSNGGTEILGSIDTVLSDITSGTLQNAGASPRIMVLSDGDSSPFGVRKLAKKCIDSGVTVGTVGFGNCNASFLKKIAASTGGVYVYADDVTALKTSMQEAITRNATRNLFSERMVLNNDLLYCIMRLVFLLILGLVWALFRVMLWQDNSVSPKEKFMIPVAEAVLACIAVEFLSATNLPIKTVRLLFCLLWTILPYGIGCFEKKPVEVKPVIDVIPPLTPTTDIGDIWNTSIDKNKNNSGNTSSIGYTGNMDIPTSNPFGNPSDNPFGTTSSGSNNPFGSASSDTNNPFGNTSTDDNPFN